MYNDEYKIASKYANSMRSFVESLEQEYEERNTIKTENHRLFSEEADMVFEETSRHNDIRHRYHTFSETIRNSLVVECLYKLYSESVSDDIKADPANRSVMRAIVNDYVQENGYNEVLNTMKTASNVMSEYSLVIMENVKSILESIDKQDPNTFAITPEMRDEFFNQLNYSDSEEISKAINARVSDAMHDFVTANTKDREDIEEALKQAREKIAETPEEDTELREFYEMKAKRKASEIRNAPKGVLHSMISTMCESILKKPEENREFLNEGHLDMDKIVSRVSLMYTFMEMLNTANLEKIDEVFIENVLVGLSK